MATNAFNLDKTHTDVSFSVKHMMVTNVRGKFNAANGVVNIDPENPTASFGSFSVDRHGRRPARWAPALRRLLRRGEQPDLHIYLHQGRGQGR